MGQRFHVPIGGGQQVVLMDSIAYVEPEDAGRVVVAGSHGGVSSGRYAMEHALLACFLNDACVGKDQAGIAFLPMLDGLGRCAATYDGMSARIGDCQDAWAHGVISHVNTAAQARGFKTGERVADAVRRVFGPMKP